MKVEPKTLRDLFRTSSMGILFYSILFVAPFIALILTFAFTNAERNKLTLLTQELAAIIKPKIQVGDEIEVQGVLTKTLETSEILSILVKGDNLRTLVASNLGENLNVSEAKETGYVDVFISPHVIQQSVFSVYPNSRESFSVKVIYPNTIRLRVIGYTLATTFAIAVFLFLTIFLRLKAVRTRIVGPLEDLRRYIENFDNEAAKNKINVDAEKLVEIKGIKEKFDLLQERLNKQQEDLLTKSVEEERGKIAAQLGHDLKSYTSILLRSIQNLRSKIGEDDLLILQKAASDIAIKMQQLQKVGVQSLSEGERSFSLQLEAYIAHLTELKSIEYGNLKRIQIEFDFVRSDFGVFAKVDPTELGTAVSNLVNNAVESIEDQGRVSLSVKRDGHSAVIAIDDNGCGIPSDQIEKVKNYGFSTKSGHGRGKGLNKAIEIVRRDGGDLSIESTIGTGTIIKLNFVEQLPRKSFAEEVDLSNVERLIIIENDREFANRIKGVLIAQKPQLNVIAFYDCQSFKTWADQQNFSTADFFFVDYDFGDPKITGLNLIEKYKLKSQAILLTHNYTNFNVLDDCDRMGVNLLPKILLDKIEVNASSQKSFENYDGYVIEDDDLHLINLRKIASERGLSLRFYRNLSDFRRDANRLKKDKIIIMDSFLTHQEKGEVHAKEFYDALGFKRIVLNTGYSEDHFRELYPQGMYWIEKIIQKDLNEVMSCFDEEMGFHEGKRLIGN